MEFGGDASDQLRDRSNDHFGHCRREMGRHREHPRYQRTAKPTCPNRPNLDPLFPMRKGSESERRPGMLAALSTSSGLREKRLPNGSGLPSSVKKSSRKAIKQAPELHWLDVSTSYTSQALDHNMILPVRHVLPRDGTLGNLAQRF